MCMEEQDRTGMFGGGVCVEEEGVVDVCSGCSVEEGVVDVCVEEGVVDVCVEEGVVDVCEGGGSGCVWRRG